MPNRFGRDKQKERIDAIQALREKGIYTSQAERRRINALMNRGYAPEEAYAGTISRGAGDYTVRSGDTYFSIAKRVYGDARFAEQVARQFRDAGFRGSLIPGQALTLQGLNTAASPVVGDAFMQAAGGLSQSDYATAGTLPGTNTSTGQTSAEDVVGTAAAQTTPYGYNPAMRGRGFVEKTPGAATSRPDITGLGYAPQDLYIPTAATQGGQQLSTAFYQPLPDISPMPTITSPKAGGVVGPGADIQATQQSVQKQWAEQMSINAAVGPSVTGQGAGIPRVTSPDGQYGISPEQLKFGYPLLEEQMNSLNPTATISGFVAQQIGATNEQMASIGWIPDANGNYHPDPQAIDATNNTANEEPLFSVDSVLVDGTPLGVALLSAYRAGVAPSRWAQGNRAFRRGRGGQRGGFYRGNYSNPVSWRTGGYI